MSGRNEEQQLFDFMEEIERAWMERGDYTVVDRIARENPAFAEKLYSFFAAVVDAPDQLDRPRPELAEQSKRIREWLLETAGGDQAEAPSGATESTGAASPTTDEVGTPQASSTFFGLLKGATDEMDPNAMAQQLYVSLDFLRDLSKNTNILPREVRAELARRAQQEFKIDASVALASLGEGGAVHRQRAASRARGKTSEPRHVTYVDLVNRSSMAQPQKQYWRSLGEEQGK